MWIRWIHYEDWKCGQRQVKGEGREECEKENVRSSAEREVERSFRKAGGPYKEAVGSSSSASKRWSEDGQKMARRWPEDGQRIVRTFDSELLSRKCWRMTWNSFKLKQLPRNANFRWFLQLILFLIVPQHCSVTSVWLRVSEPSSVQNLWVISNELLKCFRRFSGTKWKREILKSGKKLYQVFEGCQEPLWTWEGCRVKSVGSTCNSSEKLL